MINPIAAIQKYYDETVEQLKKCTWPTGSELYESTVVVISSMVRDSSKSLHRTGG